MVLPGFSKHHSAMVETTALLSLWESQDMPEDQSRSSMWRCSAPLPQKHAVLEALSSCDSGILPAPSLSVDSLIGSEIQSTFPHKGVKSAIPRPWAGNHFSVCAGGVADPSGATLWTWETCWCFLYSVNTLLWRGYQREREELITQTSSLPNFLPD